MLWLSKGKLPETEVKDNAPDAYVRALALLREQSKCESELVRLKEELAQVDAQLAPYANIGPDKFSVAVAEEINPLKAKREHTDQLQWHPTTRLGQIPGELAALEKHYPAAVRKARSAFAKSAAVPVEA